MSNDTPKIDGPAVHRAAVAHAGELGTAAVAHAQAVKEALMAAGLGEGNIEMRAPEFITGSSDDRAARRVDIVKAN